MKTNRPLLLSVLLLLSAALLAYTTARAALLAMTHDESSTYLLRGINVFSCFFSAECWGNANLHLLNTWLMQYSERLFGTSEWSLRLPNLLAHVLYLYASLRLVLSLRGHFLVALAGFMLINFNPYLLDFFSLARGYGLNSGLMMASVVTLFFFLKEQRRPILVWSYAFAFLAVMANFVALNYFVSLWGTVLVMSLLRPADRKVRLRFDWSRQVRLNAIPLAASILLAVLLYVPIRALQGGGEFVYGGQNFGGTFTALVKHSLYGANYFGEQTAPVFQAIYVTLLLSSLIGAFWFFFHRPEQAWRRYYLATALLFLFSCLVMVAQHYILGSNYLTDRKSLVFFILSGLLFYFLLYGLADRFGRGFGAVAGAIIVLTIAYHAGRTANFTYCREWWYDRDTKEMVRYLDEMPLPDTGRVRLGVNWVFKPSTSFYLDRREMSRIKHPPFDTDIQTDGRYDLYYVFGGDFERLKDQYEVEKWFPVGTVLLRRKGYGD